MEEIKKEEIRALQASKITIGEMSKLKIKNLNHKNKSAVDKATTDKKS